MRSYRYSNHISVGHRSPPPSAIGVTPSAFSASTAASKSSQVFGGSTPAFLRTLPLLNNSTGCVPRMGIP